MSEAPRNPIDILNDIRAMVSEDRQYLIDRIEALISLNAERENMVFAEVIVFSRTIITMISMVASEDTTSEDMKFVEEKIGEIETIIRDDLKNDQKIRELLN